jgi:site-specific DNA-cytosine methylase
MSCGQIAINKLGIKYDNYFASEIDKWAMQITKKNYPNTIHIGDVRDVKGSDLPEIDLLIGGSPCQSFSNAGNGKGFEGKSGIFWE